MNHVLLTPYSVKDIDAQVAKILSDLGNPAPPLRLDSVRELLNLDKDFYSTSDDSLLKSFVHSLKLAGKQIADRPGFLVDFIKSFKLDALCLLDEKRILLSSELPTAKQRWAEGHEIGHSIIPWHGPIGHGDDSFTLSSECEAIIEAEANFAARRLLFLRDSFQEYALASPPSISHILELKKTFGNTISTTFYGLIEVMDVPAFGLISCHPKRLSKDFNPEKPCRHFIRSPRFIDRFPHVTDGHLFEMARRYCGYGNWNLGEAAVVLKDINNQQFEFRMETVFNHYDALTIGVLSKPLPFTIAVQQRPLR